MNKKTIYLVFAALVIVLLTSIGIYKYYQQGDAVATVADQKITKAEYNFFLSQVISQMESSSNLTDDAAKNAFWNSNKGTDAKALAKDRTLDKAKEFKIQLIKAKERNITLDENDMKKVTTSYNDTITKAGGKDVADQKFQEVYRINTIEYLTILKDLMLAYKCIQIYSGEYKFTDVQLKESYAKSFENKDASTVVHILFRTVDDSGKALPADKLALAEKNAKDVLAKAKAGEDIKILAKTYSEDTSAQSNQGQYTFKRGEVNDTTLENWIFTAKPGDIGVVKSQYGYHVIKKPKFEDIIASVKEQLNQDEYIKQLDLWKKDVKYNLIKNQKVLDVIKIK